LPSFPSVLADRARRIDNPGGDFGQPHGLAEARSP
jgi:hypothetical protein